MPIYKIPLWERFVGEPCGVKKENAFLLMELVLSSITGTT